MLRTYYLANISRNCMKLKKIGPGRLHRKFAYVDPPLRKSESEASSPDLFADGNMKTKIKD